MAEKTKLTKEQKAAAKAKKKAEKKPSKVGMFFKNLKAELKKISWYSAHDTIQNSIWVIVAMVICAIVLGAIDWGFGSLIALLGRIG